MTIKNLYPPWYIAVYIPDISAQAYAAYHPEIQGKAFVVSRQRQDSHKSFVVSLSYEAKNRGIYYGFPIMHLVERFHDVAVVQEEPERIAMLLNDFKTVLEPYSPDVTVSAYGGAIVNVSGMQRLLKEMLYAMPAHIVETVHKTLCISHCSCGAASSAFVASMAARCAKDNDTATCIPGREKEFLAPLSIKVLPGLTDALRLRCEDYNINTVRDVHKVTREFMKLHFGDQGLQLHAMAHGVCMDRQVKQVLEPVEVSRTLEKDSTDNAVMLTHVRYCVDKLLFEVRIKKQQVVKLSLVITYSDDKRLQKTATLSVPTCDFAKVYSMALEMLDEIHGRRIAIRRISVVAVPLMETEMQLDLFDNGVLVKQENIAKGIEVIRERMGFGIVRNGNNAINNK